ncbi:MAG: hypothetical protein GY928_33840 [Colwellia sp.]|nr:hypothetical protein [Colwellia sp.]
MSNIEQTLLAIRAMVDEVLQEIQDSKNERPPTREQYNEPQEVSPVNLEGSFNFGVVRYLIVKGYGCMEIRNITYNPKFEALKPQITNVHSISSLSDLVVEFASRRMLMNELLTYLKGLNPNMYESMGPYIY